MQKSIISAILIIAMLLLSSCTGLGGSRAAMLNRFDDSGKAEARLAQIIDAINSKDREAIMAMFSKQALSEAEFIDEGMDYLFSLFTNDIESWDKIGGAVNESRNYGHNTKDSNYRYNVYAGEEKYLFNIYEHTVDTDNPENIGLYSIKVFDTKVFKTRDDEPSFQGAGIYKPYHDEENADARLVQIIDAIKNRDKAAIKAMFSEQALSEVEDIDGDIDYLFTLFADGIDSWKRISGSVNRYVNHLVKQTRSGYTYNVYAGGEEYWFVVNEYIDDTNKPQNVGIDYIAVYNTKDELPLSLRSGINGADE